MTAPEIGEILKLYTKHGWTLRRVLYSGESLPADVAEVLGDIDAESSDLDALWFARASSSGNSAWELRALSATPLAILEVVPDDADDDERQAVFADIEERLRQMLVKGRPLAN